MKVIPATIEKYISFIKFVKGTQIRFSFIDSFRFLNSSLEKLASYLNNDDKTFYDLNSQNQKNLIC